MHAATSGILITTSVSGNGGDKQLQGDTSCQPLVKLLAWNDIYEEEKKENDEYEKEERKKKVKRR